MDEAILQFDYEWREGDRDKARQIAREFVDANRAELQKIYGDSSIEDLVALVEGHRNAGRVQARIVADMWLMTEFEPQHISGTLQVGARAALEEAERIIRGKA